jgi:hypothetical protein
MPLPTFGMAAGALGTGRAVTDRVVIGVRAGAGIPQTIPERADVRTNRARKGSRGGRPSNFNAARYKDRTRSSGRSTGSSCSGLWRLGTTS